MPDYDATRITVFYYYEGCLINNQEWIEIAFLFEIATQTGQFAINIGALAEPAEFTIKN